jgi:hypothetical protein
VGKFVVVCAGALVALAGCGSDDSATQQRIRQERKDAAAKQHVQDRLKALERELARKRGAATTQGGASASAPAPSTPATSSCGAGLGVGPSTSCAFAQAVKDAYESSGGSSHVTAYSPVTHQNYSMTCTGSPVVCTGGNGASVYFP